MKKMVSDVNISSKFAVALLILILGLAFSLPGMMNFGTARAFQTGPSSGKITLLKADRPVYVPRTTAVFNVEIENDGPAVQDYQLTVVAYSPSGEEAFRSSVERINLLPAGERRLTQFQWSTSSRTEAGGYTLTAELRDLAEYDILFDSVMKSGGITFEVQSKPVLFLSDEELDFGDFLPAESPELNMFVSNTGNSILEWSITSVPEDWVELVSPIGDTKETATVVLRVKPDAPISRKLRGEVVITSNAGDREIPISGNVVGDFDGELTRVRAIKGLYRQGESVALEYTIKNTGTVLMHYSGAVTLVAPDGSIAYDGISAGENVRVSLEAEGSQTVNFIWDAPLDTPVGFYEAYVALTYWFEPEHIFYDALNDTFMRATSSDITNAVFEVKEGPTLSAEPAEWDFGTILVDQTLGSANIDISNAGGATLEWELVSWPDWIEIAKPSSMVNVGANNVLARVRPSLPASDYSGAIRIESNGGNLSIPVSLSITLPATATPAPTATVEPTATSVPTPTPVPQTPTSTPLPDRVAPARPTATSRPATSTPVPPTATVAPTATVVVVLATVEPTATPSQSGVGCSAPLGNVSLATGLLNGLLVVAPLGMIAGAKYGRRRRK